MSLPNYTFIYFLLVFLLAYFMDSNRITCCELPPDVVCRIFTTVQFFVSLFRETSASRHHGGLIKGPLLKLLEYHSYMAPRGLRGAWNGHSRMEKIQIFTSGRTMLAYCVWAARYIYIKFEIDTFFVGYYIYIYVYIYKILYIRYIFLSVLPLYRVIKIMTLISWKNSVQTLIWYRVCKNYLQTSNTYSRLKSESISNRRRWVLKCCA